VLRPKPNITLISFTSLLLLDGIENSRQQTFNFKCSSHLYHCIFIYLSSIFSFSIFLCTSFFYFFCSSLLLHLYIPFFYFISFTNLQFLSQLKISVKQSVQFACFLPSFSWFRFWFKKNAFLFSLKKYPDQRTGPTGRVIGFFRF
jgi:hypothetical protein